MAPMPCPSLKLGTGFAGYYPVDIDVTMPLLGDMVLPAPSLSTLLLDSLWHASH